MFSPLANVRGAVGYRLAAPRCSPAGIEYIRDQRRRAERRSAGASFPLGQGLGQTRRPSGRCSASRTDPGDGALRRHPRAWSRGKELMNDQVLGARERDRFSSQIHVHGAANRLTFVRRRRKDEVDAQSSWCVPCREHECLPHERLELVRQRLQIEIRIASDGGDKRRLFRRGAGGHSPRGQWQDRVPDLPANRRPRPRSRRHGPQPRGR